MLGSSQQTDQVKKLGTWTCRCLGPTLKPAAPRRTSALFARWSCGFGRSAARVMAVLEAVHSATMRTANFI
jgi:hypothetical protein